jgi:hypothetical protein
VTAIFRYLYLKSRRDQSLIAFVFTPVLIPVAAVLGVTLAKGHLHYPLFLNEQYTPSQNAALVMLVASMMAVLFANVAAFWTLRTEVATHAINAFVFGTTPATITVTLILFGSLVALAGAIGATGMTWMLTAALPPNLGTLVLELPLALLAGSAIGACVVMLSPQPVMMVVSYVGCVILIPFIGKAQMSTQLAVAGGIAIVSTALAIFLLRRRCAT